jgi:acetyl-CoA carboxylase carboxyl transferase subunit beta
MAKDNAASVAIVEDGLVLLIQRARDPYRGKWTLPGGRCEPGESAEAAAVREVREELGLTMRGLAPVAQIAFDSWRLAVFTGVAVGDIVPSDEIAGWRWVSQSEALELDTTPDLADVLRLIPALA